MKKLIRSVVKDVTYDVMISILSEEVRGLIVEEYKPLVFCIYLIFTALFYYRKNKAIE